MVLRNPADHPCDRCKYFGGYRKVKTCDNIDDIFVDIPVCRNSVNTIALGLCQSYVIIDGECSEQGIWKKEDDSELNKMKISKAIKTLDVMLSAFKTRSDLIQWTVEQKNSFITHMVAAYMILKYGDIE